MATLIRLCMLTPTPETPRKMDYWSVRKPLTSQNNRRMPALCSCVAARSRLVCLQRSLIKQTETTAPSCAVLMQHLAGLGDGAQGRNRTTDTVIFSHVLYQLSYLGAGPARMGRSAKRGRYRGWHPHCPEHHSERQSYGLTPTAARNRSLSATPSRSGSTRGGSSAAIRTRAKSVSPRFFT